MDFWMIARQELKHDLLDIFRRWGICSTSMTGSLLTMIFGMRKTAQKKFAGAGSGQDC